MTTNIKLLNNVFQIVWKIATLQYVYELLLSNPIQFLVFSPIILPVCSVLAVLTIYTAIGIAIIVCGLLVLVILSLSGPLITVTLIIFAGYVIYYVGLAIFNYVSHKCCTACGKCKETVNLITHNGKRILNEKRNHFTDYIISMQQGMRIKVSDLYEKVRDVRAFHAYISERLRRSLQTHEVSDQSERSTTMDNELSDDEININIQALSNNNGQVEISAFERYLPANPTQEKVQEIWRESEELSRRYQERRSFIPVPKTRLTGNTT